MGNKKLFILIACFFALLFGSIQMVSYGVSTTLDAHIMQAQKLAQLGIINSQLDPKDYKVESFITRGEMLKVIALSQDTEQKYECKKQFRDISETSWMCKYANNLLNNGVIAKNQDFSPQKNISQAESLKMIFGILGLTPVQKPIIGEKVQWKSAYKDQYEKLGFGIISGSLDAPATRGFIFDTLVKAKEYAKKSQVSHILEINFDQKMNQKSVEKYLKVSPKIEFTSTWKDQDTLEIALLEEIEKETQILVNVLDEALTQSGAKLQNPIVKTFQVTPNAQITFVSPEGNLERQDQVITVAFNKPMVEMTNFDTMASCPLNISPKLEGKCVWITSSVFQFRPKTGFAKGALYHLEVPANLKALDGSITSQNKSWTIKTQDFELMGLGSEISLNDKLTFIFNDAVDLLKFQKAFSLSSYNNTQLSFQYQKDSKNVIEIFPKSGDWGYDNSFEYSLQPITSLGGNIALEKRTGKFTTKKLLSSFQTFVLENPKIAYPYIPANMLFSQNSKIISGTSPYMQLSFDKEINLDRNLFTSNVPFEIFYQKEANEKNILQESKHIVIVKFSQSTEKIKLNILASKISSSKDISLEFDIAELNTIESVQMLDYKKACIVSKNPLKYGYNSLGKDIIFIPQVEVQSYLGEVSQYYTPDKNCSYQAGKHTYIVYFQADPETSYNLEIKNTLLDANNAGLTKEYKTNFVTPKAKNEDKYVYLLDGRENILVPKNISPLGVAVQSQNISQLQVEVCEGDLDVVDGIKNATCVKKNVSVQNMKFKPYVSVFDLEKIYGKKFTKQKITLQVSKIAGDKTEYEMSYDTTSKVSYLRSDIAVSVKNAINPELFIVDYVTGEKVKNIKQIEGYVNRAQYGIFGDYKGTKFEKIRDVTFERNTDGLFQLGNIYDVQDLLITLDTGEKVVLSGYFSQSNSDSQKTIFQKSKPLYKPGETVEIAGVTLTKTPEKLIQKSSKQTLIIRNPYYEEILKKEIQTDSVGSFEAEVQLSDDAPLGLYSVEFAGSSTTFQVQNYQKPEFEVSAKTSQKTYFETKTVNVEVNAKTFIGVPLENAKVNYTVYKTKKDFSSSKYSDFSFGEIVSWWWKYDFWGGKNQKNYVTSGQAVTDKNGKVIIGIVPEKDENMSYDIQISVTDKNTQKTLSSTVNFEVYGYEKVVGVKTSKETYDFGDTLEFDILTLLNNQNIAPNTSGTWKISKKEMTQDEQTLQLVEKVSVLKNQTFQTNASGMKKETFVFQDYGQFELEVQVENFITKKTFYIFGGNILTPADQEHLLLITSNNELPKIGESILYTAHTTGRGMLYVTVEKDGKIFESKTYEVKNSKTSFDLIVKKEWFPGFEVNAYFVEYSKSHNLEELKNIRSQALKIENELRKNPSFAPYFSLWYDMGGNYNTKDLQTLSDLRKQEAKILRDIFPQYFVGTLKTKIDPKEKQLQYSLTMDKIEYLPKDQAKITLSVKDNQNKNVDGVVSFVGIDASLLSLYDDVQNIYEMLYSENTNTISHYHNLTTLPARLELNVRDEGAYGGGGGDIAVESSVDFAMDDMDGGMPSVASENVMDKSTSVGSANSEVRNNFVDSAFFAKNIEVKNGVATFTISKLPDNLTTWKILGYAISKNAEVSNISEQFQVKKPIAVFPNVPRFFLQGDSGKFGFEVQNTTASSQSVTVTLSATGLEIPLKTQTIIVPANGKSIAKFDFVVTAGTQAELLITANSGKYLDTVSISRPIYESKSQEYIYSNGVTEKLSFEEKISFPFDIQKDGTLDITLGASVLHNLENILPQMISYPSYDAGSQISFLAKYSELEKIYKQLNKTEIFEKLSLKDSENKEKTLPQIQKEILKNFSQFVQKDSGIGYYPNCYWGNEEYSCSSLDLTRDFLSLGIDVENIDKKAVEKYYMQAIIQYQKRYQIYLDAKYFLPLAIKEKNFVQTHFSLPKNPSVSQKLDIIEISQKTGLYQTDAKTFLEHIKNDVMIEARGSFLNSESGNILHNTAKMLQVLDDTNSLLRENSVRYMLGVGLNNSWDQTEILQAISHYLETQDDLKNTDFSAKAFLNNQEIVSGIFDAKNTFETLKKTFALSENIWKKTNSLGFEKVGTGNLFYDIGVRYFLPTASLPSRDEGIVVQRKLYDYEDYKASFQEKCSQYPWMYAYGEFCYTEKIKEPTAISEAQVGKFLVGEIEVILTTSRKNIVVQDFIPSGTSLVNTTFATTSEDMKEDISAGKIGYSSYGFDKTELYDDKVYLYADYLPAGVYRFTYVLQTEFEGKFSHKPAVAELLDTPEIWGRSEGKIFEIKK